VFELVCDCGLCELLVLYNVSGLDVVFMGVFVVVCKR